MLGLNQRKCSPMGSGGGRGRVRASIFFYFNHFPSQFPPPPLPFVSATLWAWVWLMDSTARLSLFLPWLDLPCFFFEWIFMHSHWSLQMLFLSMAETWKKLHTVWMKHALLTLLTDMSIANVLSTSCEPIKFKKLRKHVDYSLGWVSKLSNHKSPFSAH